MSARTKGPWHAIKGGRMNLKPTATRGDGVHLVESQRTERHQATINPVHWGAPPQPWPWKWVIPCALFACAIGLAVSDPSPIHWGRVAKVAVAVPVVAIAWAAWRRLR